MSALEGGADLGLCEVKANYRPILLKNSDISSAMKRVEIFLEPDAQSGASVSAPERRLSKFSPPKLRPLVSRIGIRA